MVNRVYITPGRVSISRPGYDVLSVPRTSDYMALDSSIDIARPLRAGVILGVPVNNVSFFPWGTTYPAPPAIELYEWDGGVNTFRQSILRYDPTGSTTDVRSPYYTFSQTTQWGIRMVGGGFVDSGFVSTPRNWVYIAWAVW